MSCGHRAGSLRSVWRNTDVDMPLFPLQLRTDLCPLSAIKTSHHSPLSEAVLLRRENVLGKSESSERYRSLFYDQLDPDTLLDLELFFSTCKHSVFSGPAQFQILSLIVLISTRMFVISLVRFLFSPRTEKDYLSIFLCKQS